MACWARPISSRDLRALMAEAAARVAGDGVEVIHRREEETLRTIFDNMPVMISVYDKAGRLLRVNREWERVTGLDARRGAAG